MKPTYLTEEQFKQWDNFARSHEDGTIYHGIQWGEFLESAFPHIQCRILALIDVNNGAILAGMPIYSVNSWLLGNRLVTVPYSTWCDPLVSNEVQFKILLDEARKLAIKLNSKQIEIRTCNRKNFEAPKNWTKETHWKHHIVSLNKSEEEIWKGLHMNAIRQSIRRSDRSDISIKADSSAKGVKIFYSTLLESRKRLNLPMIPYRYFSSLMQTFSAPTRNVFIAYKNELPLCSCLVLQKNGICHLELTGEYPAARTYGAMQFLTWKALLNARKEGCQKFSFGRTNLDNHGLLQFKRRWNAVEEDLSVFTWKSKRGHAESPIKTVIKPALKRVIGVLPRPLYKSLGSFIYKHWG